MHPIHKGSVESHTFFMPTQKRLINKNIIVIWHEYHGIHYNDVIMGTLLSQITSLTIVYWTVYSDADQRKHQNPASLAFVWGIHWRPVNSPHKWPVTLKMFPFDDVIMIADNWQLECLFNTLFRITTNETSQNHYQLFVEIINQSLVGSSQKCPVMQKAFPCHDIIMKKKSFGASCFSVTTSFVLGFTQQCCFSHMKTLQWVYSEIYKNQSVGVVKSHFMDSSSPKIWTWLITE